MVANGRWCARVVQESYQYYSHGSGGLFVYSGRRKRWVRCTINYRSCVMSLLLLAGAQQFYSNFEFRFSLRGISAASRLEKAKREVTSLCLRAAASVCDRIRVFFLLSKMDQWQDASGGHLQADSVSECRR